MVTLMPELEKALPLLLNHVKTKLNKEKDNVEKILKKYRWIATEDETECRCAAVDSSFLIIESRVGHLYAIQGVAILYEFKNGVAKRLALSPFSDVGFIEAEPVKEGYVTKKYVYKKALTEYAYTLELGNLVKIVDKNTCDVALVDGSLISFLVSRKSTDTKVFIEGVYNSYRLDEIEDLKAQHIERLSKHRHTVFLAKSSNAGFYTKDIYPDMYVLELARLFKIDPYSRAGFLEPVVLGFETLGKLIKGSIRSSGEFTVTYLRFKAGIPVYQVSLPYKADVEEIKYIYSCLKKWSPSGYPLPLEYVHRFSKLPRKHLVNAMIMLSLPVVSGREIIDIG